MKDAPARELAWASAAAARNARGLADDAELLSGAGRLARATSVAGFAVEEVGKTAALALVAAMPESLKARAPVGRMLEWHQMKLVTGELIAAVRMDVPPTLLQRLAAMPPDKVADILCDAQTFALDADRLKQRGLYVDVDQGGYIREPSQFTAAQVSEKLYRDRQAASGVDALTDRDPSVWFTAPAAIVAEFSGALFRAISEAGHQRSPEAAAEVLLSAASKLHD